MENYREKVQLLLPGWNVDSTPDCPHTIHTKGAQREGGLETPWPGSVQEDFGGREDFGARGGT